MNKQIEELASQAISDVDYIRFTDTGEPDELLNAELANMYIPSCFAERFAELIVKECADVIKYYHSRNELITPGQILQHFGVKQ